MEKKFRVINTLVTGMELANNVSEVDIASIVHEETRGADLLLFLRREQVIKFLAIEKYLRETVIHLVAMVRTTRGFLPDRTM